MTDSTVAMRESSVVLYVFSGVHLGARIELTDGSWILGSEDTCDLILTGLVAQHALVVVENHEDGIHVLLSPKEGPVCYKDNTVSETTELEAGVGWYLGETLFAWNYKDAQQEVLIPNLGAEKNQEEKTEAFETSQDAEKTEQEGVADDSVLSEDQELSPKAADQPESQEPTPEVSSSASEESKSTESNELTLATPPAKPPFWKRAVRFFFRPLFLGFLALLLCALSVPLTQDSGPNLQEVELILKELGISGLQVSLEAPGILLEGAVRSWDERKRIQDRVEKLSYPVYLNIAVDNDLVQAVHNSLGLQGFFPLVHVHRSDERTTLAISCFMRDSLIEASAFAQLANDVATPLKLERHIVYANDVEPALRAALNSAGYSDIEVMFLPGRVSFSGSNASLQSPALRQLRGRMSAKFGVPLFGEELLRNPQGGILVEEGGSVEGARLSLPPQSAIKKGGETQANPSEIQDALGGLTITGVFVAPISFVTTDDGRYLFQGAVLPNGDLLMRITTKELLLRRGNTVYTYHLRGSYE